MEAENTKWRLPRFAGNKTAALTEEQTGCFRHLQMGYVSSPHCATVQIHEKALLNSGLYSLTRRDRPLTKHHSAKVTDALKYMNSKDSRMDAELHGANDNFLLDEGFGGTVNNILPSFNYTIPSQEAEGTQIKNTQKNFFFTSKKKSFFAPLRFLENINVLENNSETSQTK